MNLVHQLFLQAQRHPERIALAEATRHSNAPTSTRSYLDLIEQAQQDVEISYLELIRQVSAGAIRLKQAGLKKGDSVLILQPVSIQLYISLLSVFHAGLTAIFIDPSAPRATIRHCLQLQPPQAFIATPKAHLLRLYIPDIRRIPHQFHSSGWVPFSKPWLPHSPDAKPPARPTKVSEDTPALITFTSGSTGMPKAACRTHGFLLAQHQALAEALDFKEGEVDLITLPIFALANLASGMTSIIADTDLRAPAKANSPSILRQCQTHRVTRCAASPAFFAKLHADNHFPPFQTIYTGGAPVFPDLLTKLQTAHPKLNIITVYGSTEAEPISHSQWNNTSDKEKSLMANGFGLLVGPPVTATQLRLITVQPKSGIPPLTETTFQQLEMPVGKIGEIVVTGAHVLKGYLHGKGNDENKFQVHSEKNNSTTIWHRTGDAGWRDAHGKIWLVGRCSAAIPRANDEPLYPFGIECAAQMMPEIYRCALVSHRYKITLAVQLAPSHSSTNRKTLETTLRQKFPELQQIIFLKSLPMDHRHNAKINYPELFSLLKRA